MKIIKKGYKIDLDKIEQGYHFSERVCVADNKNQARSILMKEIKYKDWFLKWSDFPITFLTIPVIRCESADVVLFEDKKMSRSQVSDLLNTRKHNKELDKLSKNKSVQFCYIRKHGYYYRENSKGYDMLKINAGIYTKEDAIYHAKGCRELDLIPVNVKEHNSLILESIKKLQTKLLPVYE